MGVQYNSMAQTTPPKNERPEAEDIILQWEAPKFIFYDKDVRWHSTVAVVAVAVVLVAIVAREQLVVPLWMIIPVIVICAGILMFQGVIKPALTNYAIGADGMHVNDEVHQYEQFRSFSIVAVGERAMLRLLPVQKLFLPISIILKGVDADDVREVLSQVLPEEEHEQTLTDRVSHFLRF